jgi:hypothetical protein
VLQAIYIILFAILATLAIANLIRSMFNLGISSQGYGTAPSAPASVSQATTPLHPELLDDRGHVISEPLLVMRQLSVDDVRDRLDALYEASPGSGSSTESDPEGEPPAAV